jgi:putative ABC transport system ATP-binding protein
MTITTSIDAGIACRAINLVKVYGSGGTGVRALDGLSVEFRRGEFTAIMGPSGSGKSTLMHCLAGLDTATSGTVTVGATDLSALSDKKMTKLRRDRIGFVFQSYNLVPTLTAIENISLPVDIAGRRPNAAWLRQIVHTLGLADRLHHRPAELSGGQQQRVACARALISQPEIIFGDEPTGNLDSRSSGEVLGILRNSVDRLGPDRRRGDARPACGRLRRPGRLPGRRTHRRRDAPAHRRGGPRPHEEL